MYITVCYNPHITGLYNPLLSPTKRDLFMAHICVCIFLINIYIYLFTYKRAPLKRIGMSYPPSYGVFNSPSLFLAAAALDVSMMRKTVDGWIFKVDIKGN